MLGMTVCCFAVWVLATRSERRGNWFHPVVLFTVSYLFVFYQVPWCIAAGLDTGVFGAAIRDASPYPGLINACATMAFMGYAFFCCGYLLSIRYRVLHGNGVNGAGDWNTVRYSVDGLGRMVGILLVPCWIVFFGFAIMAGPAFLSAFTYSAGLDWGPGASYALIIHGLMDALLLSSEGLRVVLRRPATFKQYCTYYDRRVLFYYLVATAPFALAGDRGSVVSAAFFLLGPYFVFVKPLRKRALVIAFVMGAVLMVFLGAMRTRDANESLGARLTKGSESIRKLSWSPDQWPTSKNLALSYKCFNVVLKIVPEEYPYGLGVFQLGSFLSAIPFYRRVFPLGKDYFGDAPHFLTYYLHDGDMSVGVGSACLATIYLDFGVRGIPPFMAALGFFFGYLARKAQILGKNAIFWQAIFYYAIYWGLRIPRSDPFHWIQTFVWEGVLFLFCIRFLLWKSGAIKRAR
jgi:hypothetical protein